MQYRILDLDNCIANDAWRIPRISWQHIDPDRKYHDYHMLAGFDEVGNEELFKGRSNIIIFTARPVLIRAMTEEWLRRKGVDYDILMMRNNGDHRKSVDLKMQQLHWLSQYSIELKQIEHAFDDRQDVIDMYKKCGVPATVRAIHNVCAYTRPML